MHPALDIDRAWTACNLRRSDENICSCPNIDISYDDFAAPRPLRLDIQGLQISEGNCCRVGLLLHHRKKVSRCMLTAGKCPIIRTSENPCLTLYLICAVQYRLYGARSGSPQLDECKAFVGEPEL